MIEIEDIDAEALMLELGLSDYDLLVEPVPDLIRRRLPPDLAGPLRRRWVGSTRGISRRWAAIVGMGARVDLGTLARSLGKGLDQAKQALAWARISALPLGASPRCQYALAKAIFETAIDGGVRVAAMVYRVRVQEAALYRRRFARMLSELGPDATEEDAVRLWHEVWALEPEFLRRRWTESPRRMFDILEGEATMTLPGLGRP